MVNEKIKTLISRVDALKLKRYTALNEAKVFRKNNYFAVPDAYDFSCNKIDGINNFISFKQADIDNFSAQISGDRNKLIIRKNSTAKNVKLSVRGAGNFLDIKENCELGNLDIIFSGNNGKLIIEKNSIMWDVHFTVYPESSISIGKNCLFSTDIDIRSGDGHKIIDLKTGQILNSSKNVTIEDRVWLCQEVKILKGVRIGKNSVVGFGSLCTRSIPNNCLAAGSPAKIKRENITWQR